MQDVCGAWAMNEGRCSFLKLDSKLCVMNMNSFFIVKMQIKLILFKPECEYGCIRTRARWTCRPAQLDQSIDFKFMESWSGGA